MRRASVRSGPDRTDNVRAFYRVGTNFPWRKTRKARSGFLERHARASFDDRKNSTGTKSCSVACPSATVPSGKKDRPSRKPTRTEARTASQETWEFWRLPSDDCTRASDSHGASPQRLSGRAGATCPGVWAAGRSSSGPAHPAHRANETARMEKATVVFIVRRLRTKFYAIFARSVAYIEASPRTGRTASSGRSPEMRPGIS